MSSLQISGVLVHAHPLKITEVRDALSAMNGVEVHQETDDGRLIITVEESGEVRAGDSLLEIHRIDGVITASLVYHHFDDNEDDYGQLAGSDYQETSHAH